MLNKIVEKSSEENKLMARIESMTAENDFTKEQLSALKAKYENIKNGEISGLLKPIKDAAGNICHLALYVCASLASCPILLCIIFYFMTICSFPPPSPRLKVLTFCM